MGCEAGVATHTHTQGMCAVQVLRNAACVHADPACRNATRRATLNGERTPVAFTNYAAGNDPAAYISLKFVDLDV